MDCLGTRVLEYVDHVCVMLELTLALYVTRQLENVTAM